MYGIIYKATFPNGKKYIGQTTKTLSERKSGHERASRTELDLVIYRAMRKYGFENITWEIIDEAKDHGELNTKERHYIKKYRSFTGYNDSKGYNRTLGGAGFEGVHTEESKIKMSMALKGKYAGSKNPSARKVVCINTGEVFDTVKQASKAYGAPYAHIGSCCSGARLSSGINKKGEKLVWAYHEDFINMSEDDILTQLDYAENSRVGVNHHWYEVGMSEESRAKMSASAIERYKKSEHPRNRKVRCLNTGEVFNSIMDASRHYNIYRTTISQCCAGTRKSAGKHPITNEKMTWEYMN